MKPKISVIVPVYNTARWLPDCLDSILGQTEKSLEVVCIDDCSTDDSVSVVNRYVSIDSRVRLLRLQDRASTGEVRNAGMRIAVGEYVAFMDSDDLYPSADTLSRLMKILESTRCKVAVGYAVYFVRDDKLTAKLDEPAIGYSGSKGIVSYCDWQDVRGFCACLYERKFLFDNRLVFPPLTRNEDPVFFMNVMLVAGKFAALDECTYLYRIGYKTVDWSGNAYKLKKEHVRGLLDMFSLAKKNSLDKLESQMVRELAGSINSLECFNALGEIGDAAIAAISGCRCSDVDDKRFVYRWIVREQSKFVRVCFVFCKFGVLNVGMTMISCFFERLLSFGNARMVRN